MSLELIEHIAIYIFSVFDVKKLTDEQMSDEGVSEKRAGLI